MREILFRGKTNNYENRWVYGQLIYPDDDYCCILERVGDVDDMDYPHLDGVMGWIDGFATPVRPETVGQFVYTYGGLDMDGKRIFIGDIVSNIGDTVEIVARLKPIYNFKASM